ncbi:hypothetical protein BO71DRAFT_412752 [Aspergillus ellipticus CBS 707.79]|uniref:Uncharacterized protein n=1 Tax=Aspergillus ellipticus CBS 707.79 TaxID=1448320 RepID=A0A319CZS3_9EURO|nr:hypothetical protein BO71DRAFT_412752 [Aspergillus ellipticus CBS 707.79]
MHQKVTAGRPIFDQADGEFVFWLRQLDLRVKLIFRVPFDRDPWSVGRVTGTDQIINLGSQAVESRTILLPGWESPRRVSRLRKSRPYDIPDHEAGAARQDEWAALRDTLSRGLSEDDSISVYGASLTRAHVGRLLAELQTPGGLSDFSVDLLGERLARQHHAQNLRIGDVGWKDQLHRGSLRLYPLPRTLLLPDSSHGHWSLIEIQTSTGAVVHYSFASKEPSAHDISRPQACSTCQAATTALSQHLRECQQPCPEWQVDHQCLASDGEVDRSETRFLWTMAQRAGGLPVQGDPPDTFRSSLAQTIVAEVLQPRTSQPPSLIGHSGTLDLTSTWQRVAQMSLGGAPMGWEQADRLLQLTFNIASPAVLVGIKRQLSHLRAREHDATRPFGRSAAGVFEAVTDIKI